MKDLTQGSIVSHILSMATPAAVGMLSQIAYQLVDLYFVTRISVAATAGVNAAANAGFIVAALMQMLSVGVVALVAQAVGRGDRAEVNRITNQSIGLSALCGVMVTALAYVFSPTYMLSISADEPTVEAGTTFIAWTAPGYTLTLLSAVLSSALRGTGIVKPTIVFYSVTVLSNVILAPILIAGWGTGVPLGVRGAGLATTLSIAVGFLFFVAHIYRAQSHIVIEWGRMFPRLAQWGRIINVGAPAGGDHALFFVYNALVYYTIQSLGPDAQAGFGVGSRIVLALLLPALCICLAAGPIVGQNFGAANVSRVKETFRTTIMLGSAAMLMTTGLVHWQAEAIVRLFASDAPTVDAAVAFVKISSWAFLAQGIVTTCSSMFQGLGNTLPALICSCVRLLSFAIPAIWLSGQANFRIEQVWHLAVATLLLQGLVGLWMLRLEFKKRLMPLVDATHPVRRLGQIA